MSDLLWHGWGSWQRTWMYGGGSDRWAESCRVKHCGREAIEQNEDERDPG